MSEAPQEPQGRPTPPSGDAPPPPPPGYGPPPPQGYGQQYGQYPPPPQHGQPPQHGPSPMSPNDERTWALFSHLGGLLVAFVTWGLFAWIVPLVIMSTKGQESSYVRHHAVESLNFQLTMLIAGVVSSILVLVIIGVLLLVAVGVAWLVFGILASVAANRGELYRYPVNIRMVQ